MPLDVGQFVEPPQKFVATRHGRGDLRSVVFVHADAQLVGIAGNRRQERAAVAQAKCHERFPLGEMGDAAVHEGAHGQRSARDSEARASQFATGVRAVKGQPRVPGIERQAQPREGSHRPGGQRPLLFRLNKPKRKPLQILWEIHGPKQSTSRRSPQVRDAPQKKRRNVEKMLTELESAARADEEGGDDAGIARRGQGQSPPARRSFAILNLTDDLAATRH